MIPGSTSTLPRRSPRRFRDAACSARSTPAAADVLAAAGPARRRTASAAAGAPSPMSPAIERVLQRIESRRSLFRHGVPPSVWVRQRTPAAVIDSVDPRSVPRRGGNRARRRRRHTWRITRSRRNHVEPLEAGDRRGGQRRRRRVGRDRAGDVGERAGRRDARHDDDGADGSGCGPGAADAERTITVSGHGTVSVVPDTADLMAGVQAQAATATEALDTVGTKSQALIDHAEGHGHRRRGHPDGRSQPVPDLRQRRPEHHRLPGVDQRDGDDRRRDQGRRRRRRAEDASSARS